MVREFIAGWDVMQILGEGTFAQVKLLLNRETGEACAMKEVDLSQEHYVEEGGTSLRESLRKEICLHKLICHPHIVRCYGSRIEGQRQFIFLEYCPGGELFDRIEPGTGMAEYKAHNFFLQIISAVEYLHDRGIAHRDIKPENLLISEGEVLKLSDLGMATVFRHKGQERLLERKCGTRPYLAPEVLIRPQYHAEPADIWSCGVVLLAMLVGELPWDHPLSDQKQYVAWKKNNTNQGMWTRLENLPLSLLRKVLHLTPAKRASISYIKSHLWFKKRFRDDDGRLLEPVLVTPPIKRVFPGAEFPCLSQQPEHVLGERNRNNNKNNKIMKSTAAPAPNLNNAKTPTPKFPDAKEQVNSNGSQNNKTQSKTDDDIGVNAKAAMANYGSYSQPARMFGNSQTQTSNTQGSSQGTQSSSTVFHRLVKRITRFWVTTNFERTEEYVTAVLKKLGYNITYHSKGLYTLSTKDRRGTLLIIKCMFVHMDGKVMVDFRMSRGCGLEFKKYFAQIKLNCHEIMDKAPILWPALVPLDALPQMID